MFDWLFEGRLVVYLALGVAALAVLAMLRQKPSRNLLIAAGILAFLALVYFLLNLLIESDREQVVRKAHEVAAAVDQRQYDRAFQDISESFVYQRSDKQAMRGRLADAIKNYDIRNIKLKSMEVLSMDRKQRKATVRFNATADNNQTRGWGAVPVEVDFVLESDGQWRARTFRLFNPFVGSAEEWVPPGL